MTVSAQYYVDHGMKKVDGWLSRDAAELIRAVDAAQRDIGATGSVAEIGIHHGKLFILLALLRRPGEGALAVDLFEDQGSNIDGSGYGDRDAFEKALRLVGLSPDEITIVADSSLDLEPEFVTSAVGPIRLFSIDGGHTAEITRSDLILAERTIDPRGVVILDDVANSEWPGVVTGIAAYLAGGGTLVPFVVSPQKTLLAREEYATGFRRYLEGQHSANFLKQDEFFSHPVAVFCDSPHWLRAQLANSGIYQRVKENPLVQQVRPKVLSMVDRGSAG